MCQLNLLLINFPSTNQAIFGKLSAAAPHVNVVGDDVAGVRFVVIVKLAVIRGMLGANMNNVKQNIILTGYFDL